MNIAIVLAGGSGKRTEQDIPKQFMNVYEKPIVIYTLEAFQGHPDIDGIVLVCIEGWQEIVLAYAKEYKLDKLKWIVTGGENGQESTQKGIEILSDVCSAGDIILIHDAIRPMVNQEIISDCIVKCRVHGSGLSAVRCQETIVKTENGICGKSGIARNEIMRVQTPQAYSYDRVKWAYEEAGRREIRNSIYTNMLMLELGETLYFAKGSEKNVKITTMEDIEIFKALYKMKREDWVK